MDERLEDANPDFITWAIKNDINLDEADDYNIWLNCWVDGYAHGVNDVKSIIRNFKAEDSPDTWWCCGVKRHTYQSCQCGAKSD